MAPKNLPFLLFKRARVAIGGDAIHSSPNKGVLSGGYLANGTGLMCLRG